MQLCLVLSFSLRGNVYTVIGLPLLEVSRIFNGFNDIMSIIYLCIRESLGSCYLQYCTKCRVGEAQIYDTLVYVLVIMCKNLVWSKMNTEQICGCLENLPKHAELEQMDAIVGLLFYIIYVFYAHSLSKIGVALDVGLVLRTCPRLCGILDEADGVPEVLIAVARTH